MGGYGSGPGPGKPNTDRALGLRVDDLRQRGLFVAPAEGSLTVAWRLGDQDAGNIVVRYDAARPDRVTLEYAARSRADGPWRPVRECIALERVPQPLGGARVWFVCPGCATRRGVLYERDGAFRCRACQDLVYRSTTEDEGDRARRRLNTALARLDDGPRAREYFAAGIWPARPKGMHARTHARRRRELLALARRVDAAEERAVLGHMAWFVGHLERCIAGGERFLQPILDDFRPTYEAHVRDHERDGLAGGEPGPAAAPDLSMPTGGPTAGAQRATGSGDQQQPTPKRAA